MRLAIFFLAIFISANLTVAGPRVDPFSKIPLGFEPAPGQPGSYFARGPGYLLGIRATESVLTCRGPHSTTLTPVHISFLHARAGNARVEALDPLPSRTNYFIGHNPRNWRTAVVSFGKVRVAGIYSGIDLVYYGAAASAEYDFVVHSGADPRAIEFQVTGADEVRTGPEGDLILTVDGREIRWKAPLLYQETAGRRARVDGSFVLGRRNRVRFRVGDYDRTRDLVVDPALVYASYLGGSGNDAAAGIATDTSGNVYVAGGTISTNLAVTGGAFQPTYGGPADAFIAKFTPSGALIYLTYLGGAQDDYAVSVAVDAAGNAFLAGKTNSTNFPVTPGAFQKTFGGAGGNPCEGWFGDGFVAKLNPTGSQLIYSTYLGGHLDDVATAIAIDSTGNAYVTGFTLSNNFPTTAGAYQTVLGGVGGQTGKPACNGGPWFNSGDAFVSKLNASGSQLIFSTYLGGSNDEFGLTIGLDSSQNVYVGGYTLSRNFPVTPGAMQNAFKGTDPQNYFFHSGDGFVAKLSNSGATLNYATYLGGVGDDAVTSLFVAPDGSVWVTGCTSSIDFPVAGNAVQKQFSGYSTLPFLVEQLVGDAFATHIDPTGQKVLYSTFLGGSQNDLGASISVDSAGLVYVVGFTDSTDFPVSSNALQPKMAGDGGQAKYFLFGDGFVTVINPNSGQIAYSTYFGGVQDDMLLGMTLDGAGGLWATGNTISPNLPVTTNAVQKVYGGGMFSSVAVAGDSLLVHYTNLGSGPSILTNGAGVINGGSYLPGNVVSGSWVSIKGTGFTDQTVNWSNQNFSNGLPTSLNGVQVLFNGQPGAVWYLIAGTTQQINVQAPANLSGNVTVQVVRNGVPSNTVTTTAVAVAPAIFAYTLDNGVTFYASAVFADGTYLGDPAIFPGARKAKAGDKVSLFANSLAPSPAGVVSVSATTDPVTVTIGSTTFAADFSGLVAPGEFQINITIPNLPAPGNFPITIQIDGKTSQSAVLIPYN